GARPLDAQFCTIAPRSKLDPPRVLRESAVLHACTPGMMRRGEDWMGTSPAIPHPQWRDPGGKLGVQAAGASLVLAVAPERGPERFLCGRPRSYPFRRFRGMLKSVSDNRRWAIDGRREGSNSAANWPAETGEGLMNVEPILRSELTRTARRRHHYGLRAAIGLIPLTAVGRGDSQADMDVARRGVRWGESGSLPRYAELGFLDLAWLSGVAILLVVPGLVAGSIAEEDRRGTMQDLMASPLSSVGIVVGKLAARLVQLGV